MGVTLDTSALIDVLRGNEALLRETDLQERTKGLPVLSTVAVFEVLSGVEYTRSRLERTRLETLLARFHVEPFDRESARRAAELRGELLRTGRSPGAPDVMIAGQALAGGHTLITRDRQLGKVANAFGLNVVFY
ncbi:MAG: type II toxin-antitoxin system VapC family toxin [Thermoplasmata archaeon]|nr:type II toxin-antitoxin system VapC family toxin [Thermoplasmata archaeon]